MSDDGTIIRSNPGVGIIKGGWHCGGNPAPTAEAEQDQCEKSAEDTAKKAEEFANTNPNAAPFAKIQACIARKTCSQAKDGTINDPEWAETVVPKFIDRFLDQTGNWSQILELCENPPATGLHIIFPFPILISQQWCARIMAKQHIEEDLGDALTSTGKLLGNPGRGCGSREDWDKVFDNIIECIPEGELFDPLGFAESEVEERREDVRNSCRIKAGLPPD